MQAIGTQIAGNQVLIWCQISEVNMGTGLVFVWSLAFVSVLVDEAQLAVVFYLIYENLAFVIVGSIDQLTLVIDRDIAEWCSLFNDVIERLKISCKACDSSFSLFSSDTVEVSFSEKRYRLDWVQLPLAQDGSMCLFQGQNCAL